MDKTARKSIRVSAELHARLLEMAGTLQSREKTRVSLPAALDFLLTFFEEQHEKKTPLQESVARATQKLHKEAEEEEPQ